MAKKIFLFSNLLLVAVICLIFMLFGWRNSKADDDSFRLMVFGDSLAAGYGLPEGSGYTNQLQKALENSGLDNVTVINSAVSGNTTADGVNRLNEAIAQKPHAVIVELGANDLLQALDINRAKQNLETIITTFQEKDIPVMLIGIRIPMLTDAKGREDLSKAYKELARKYKLALYPNFMEDVITETFGVYNLKNTLPDGAHPNAAGVQIMVKKTLPVVIKFLNNL